MTAFILSWWKTLKLKLTISRITPTMALLLACQRSHNDKVEFQLLKLVVSLIWLIRGPTALHFLIQSYWCELWVGNRNSINEEAITDSEVCESQIKDHWAFNKFTISITSLCKNWPRPAVTSAWAVWLLTTRGSRCMPYKNELAELVFSQNSLIISKGY